MAKNKEIILIGAGMAGLSLAALLARQGIGVTVIDREDPGEMATDRYDSRTVALSAGTRTILEPLNIWDDLLPQGTAITSIDVQEGHDAFILNFDARGTQNGAFGWIFPNSAVRGALYHAAKKHGVNFITGVSLKNILQTEKNVTAVLSDGTEISAQLLIGADGRQSRVRALLGIDTVDLDYKQTAFVGLITHENPHQGLALERFYPDGPFAVLPFTDQDQQHRSAIVWTRHARKKLPLPTNDDITVAITPFFDERYGAINAVGKWAAFPLTLHHAKSFISNRVALISDAAHAIHPIAGQGLNLGMRDVQALSVLLGDAKPHNSDLGEAALLQAYQRARRSDVFAMVAATDLLNRLFGNNVFVLRWLRSAGLGLVDKIPPLKKFFMHVAMGQK